MPSPYLEILRPVNCLMAALGVWIGFLLVSNALYTPLLPLALVSAFLICGAGQTINDYFDYKIDRRKAPERPVPAGQIAPDLTTYYAFSLFGIGILLSVFLGTIPFLIALLYSVLLILYSARLRKQKWAGNMVVASATAVTLVYGAALAGINALVLVLAAAAFLANLAREIIKDAADMEADKGAKETLPMKVSPATLKGIIGGLYLLAVGISYFVFLQLGFGKIGYLLLVTLANLLFLVSFRAFLQQNYVDAHRKSKMAMGIALLAFLAGGLGI